MKKLKIDALFFVLMITVLGLLNLFSTNKPTVSNLENRALKQSPAFSLDGLFSGQFFKDYEDYYSDTFVLRENLVRLSRDFREAMSFMEPDVTLVTAYEDIQLPPEPETPVSGTPSTSLPQSEQFPIPSASPSEGAVTSAPSQNQAKEEQKEPAKDYGDGQNVGYWLVVDGKAVQLFKFNKESFEYYAQVLNQYKEKLGDKVKIYSMIPPTAGEFLKLKKYKGITDSQNDALGFLESKLNPEISTVNVYDALNSHKEEYIYFKTDHHWTALGAYYAYSAFMKDKNEQPVALESYETVDLGEFLGSSYTKTLDKSLEKNPDQVTAYMPFTDYDYLTYHEDKEIKADVIDLKYKDDINNKYLAFISTGGATWSVIKTDVQNGKKILVIKDSFGNALVPFLLPHYEEIYVVDSRFYSINVTGKTITEFIADHGINELLFVIYMEDVNWHKFMNGVENLLGKG